MGFLFGGGKAKTTQVAPVAGMQIQSSSQGLPVPICYGTNALAPNLIWYGDFVAVNDTSQSAGGGGKGGSGGGSGGGKAGGGRNSGQYLYSTALLMALCEGTIVDVPNVYVNKNVYTPADLGLSIFTGSYLQTAWGYLSAKHGGAISESKTIPGSPYQVSVSNPTKFIADFGVTGTTVNIGFTLVASAPAANQYRVTASGRGGIATLAFNAANAGANVQINYKNSTSYSVTNTYTIPASAPYEIQLTGVWLYSPINSVTQIVSNFTKVGSAPAVNQYSVANGIYTFNAANAGANININYGNIDSSQALNYHGIAYLAASNYQLGNSPQLPNHTFVVRGVYSNSIAGQIDADPSLVISDLLSNNKY
ncbi:MAG: hypothetical protein WCL30_06535, partial [Pseudomonadota bacterium]